MSALAHFHSPWWLLGLVLVPALVAYHHRSRPTAAVTFSRLPQAPSGIWRLHLPFYLRLAALALLLVALARPQSGYSWVESDTEGIDIQIVLDISGSMAAEDFQPQNRLEAAKQVVGDFIDRRTADRVGLVVFAGTAIVRAPLTTDYGILHLLLDSVRLETLPDGTAIGVALASAANRLKESKAESKVIVLVTDGINNSGEIDPASAAAICEGLGIRAYTIAVGTDGEVPIQITERDPYTGRMRKRRITVELEVDEELLQAIAERTNGRFYNATDPQALRAIFAEIDQLEKTVLQTKEYTRYEEAFAPWAFAALAAMLLPLATRAVQLTVEP